MEHTFSQSLPAPIFGIEDAFKPYVKFQLLLGLQRTVKLIVKQKRNVVVSHVSFVRADRAKLCSALRTSCAAVVCSNNQKASVVVVVVNVVAGLWFHHATAARAATAQATETGNPRHPAPNNGVASRILS